MCIGSIDSTININGSGDPEPSKDTPTKPNWTKREDKMLKKAIKLYKDQGFSRIAQEVIGRTKQECKLRCQELREKRRLKKIRSEKESNIKEQSSEEDKQEIDHAEDNIELVIGMNNFPENNATEENIFTGSPSQREIVVSSMSKDDAGEKLTNSNKNILKDGNVNQKLK